MDFFPRKPQTIQHTGAKIFHHDVAFFEQIDKHFFALRRFHVDRDRALVAIEHREIQRIRTRNIAQLPAGGITLRRLEFDHVRTHPGE